MARMQKHTVKISARRYQALLQAEELHKERHRATYSMLMAAVAKFEMELVVTPEDMKALDGMELKVDRDEDGAIRMVVVPMEKAEAAE